MTEYDSGPRPLPWPLRNTLVYSRTTEDDGDCDPSSFVWPEDSDERVFVPFYLSLNEYNVLSSTIDVGSDIAYGADAIRVIDLWLRNMRCNVSICAAMIQCIQTDPDVQQALRDFMAAEIYTSGPVNDAVRGVVLSDPALIDLIRQTSSQQAIDAYALATSILKEGECGLGYLYSQTVTVVQTLHTLTQNVFTNVSTGVDANEWASLFLAIFPLTMNAFNTAFLLGVASAVVGAVRTAYDAQWQDEYIDTLTCALFCRVKDSCALSMDDIVTFYIEWSGLSVTNDVYQSFVDVLYIVQNGSYGARSVPLMHLLMATAIRLSMNVLGIDFGQYALTITASGDIEDNGYLTECADCPEEFELEAVTGLGYPEDSVLFAGYESGDMLYDWYSAATPNYGKGALVSVPTVGFKVRSIEVIQGAFDPGAYLEWGGVYYDLDTFPYNTVAASSAGMYLTAPDLILRLRVYAA